MTQVNIIFETLIVVMTGQISNTLMTPMALVTGHTININDTNKHCPCNTDGTSLRSH